MTKRLIAGLALFSAIAALSACASSGDGASGFSDRISAIVSGDAFFFAAADADGDFVTTEAEVQAALTQGFAAADADQSGALSPLEWQSFSRTQLGGDLLGPFRLEFDRNVDNSIDAQEFADAFIARFGRYDGDADGRIARTDMVRALDTSGAVRERPRPNPRPATGY